MEELALYLDLVESLGDPFTIFERDWPESDEDTYGRHAMVESPTVEIDPKHAA